MRILFICDAFPPDTTIGGIRPFMFAKYLQQFGHEVTVLRSGKIYSMKSTTEYDSWLGKMRIISAFNGNTVAGVQPLSKKDRKTPGYVKEIYFALREPLNILKNHKHFDTLYKKQKAAIDDLRRERYDIVFSTFSPASDIYSGEYAAKKFGCKWILDFRDAMIQPDNRTWLWNRFFRNTQVKAVEKCDLCTTVSDGVRRMVSAGTKSAKKVNNFLGKVRDKVTYCIKMPISV